MENYKINRDKKTFVFDDGQEIPIPADKVKEVLRSPAAHKSKKEATEKWKDWSDTVPIGGAPHAFINNLSESVFGNPGDTIANYGVSAYKALDTGEGQEEMGYVDRVLDHFYAMQEGRKEHLATQSAENPKSAFGGQIAGLGVELGTLHGVPAAAALPIIGAGHSETSFLEPGEKLIEAGQEAALGYSLDKFFGAASKVAGHRATRRGVQDAIRSVEEGNAAEIQRATAATDAEAGRFANETAAREAEISGIPARQQAENKAFIDSSSQRVERVAQTLGETPIAIEAIGVEPFIEDVIQTSVNAGTKEGNSISRFLKSIFKGDSNGKISGQNIQRGMRAVDEGIAKETGAAREMLVDFKNYLTQELPAKLGNFFAYEKWAPRIQNRIFPAIEKDFTNIFKGGEGILSDLKKSLGKNFTSDLNASLRNDISGVFQKNAGNFEEALINGSLTQEIQAAIEANPIYQKLSQSVTEYTPNYLQKGVPKDMVYSHAPAYAGVESEVLAYPANIAERVTNATERYLPDIRLDVSTKSGVADKSLSQAPRSPNMIQQPAPVSPAQSFNPNLSPVPQIPEAQGVMQRLAYGLEGISEGGVKGLAQGVQNNAGAGLLAKVAGVPVGKIAGAAAGVVTGLSALTSPSAIGRITRGSLEVTARMMNAVQQRANQYPSHVGNGVLNDPMERRSLVKEIEDDRNMRLEDKAIIQSKVNRGQALLPDVDNRQNVRS